MLLTNNAAVLVAKLEPGLGPCSLGRPEIIDIKLF